MCCKNANLHIKIIVQTYSVRIEFRMCSALTKYSVLNICKAICDKRFPSIMNFESHQHHLTTKDLNELGCGGACL